MSMIKVYGFRIWGSGLGVGVWTSSSGVCVSNGAIALSWASKHAHETALRDLGFWAPGALGSWCREELQQTSTAVSVSFCGTFGFDTRL